MTGIEKLAQIAIRAGITAEDMQEIFDKSIICPMYKLIDATIQARFVNETKCGEHIGRYASDDEASLEDAIDELFKAADYNYGDYSVEDHSLFDSPGYETGYCTISWISKHTKKLETFNFQWEIV